ncbi:MAG: chemotaxis response regulator protein-glutamate methylesterase [Clostridiales bacterium GWB2_37_7]|nr:MAG: chemotaxis response regulator protein-glutamate methylesterase [Clostridiales bacterium GWB2_37_7]
MIKVLIVDDSLLFREIISRGISIDPSIKVVAVATDPFDARDKIIKHMPDVMICDVEMPKMNGIEFIRRLLPQYMLPVIVVSTISDAVFDAISAGAVDFLSKPNAISPNAVESFILELVEKVKIAASANVIKPQMLEQRNINSSMKNVRNKIIAIGASTGGPQAISVILKSLPQEMPGIVIVQHIPPVFSRMFAERLNNTTALFVKEAENGDYIEPGKVFIAPGDKHMRIRRFGDAYKVECFVGEKVTGHCPSVDVLFESVAKEAGNNAIGILLTGMGYDGAKGLLSMRRKGARTIGQDEKTSVVYGMPKVAHEIGAVEKQAALDMIPNLIYKVLS